MWLGTTRFIRTRQTYEVGFQTLDTLGLCALPGPPGPDPDGGLHRSFAQNEDGGDMNNVKWGEKPAPDKMPGKFEQHYKP